MNLYFDLINLHYEAVQLNNLIDSVQQLLVEAEATDNAATKSLVEKIVNFIRGFIRRVVNTYRSWTRKSNSGDVSVKSKSSNPGSFNMGNLKKYYRDNVVKNGLRVKSKEELISKLGETEFNFDVAKSTEEIILTVLRQYLTALGLTIGKGKDVNKINPAEVNEIKDVLVAFTNKFSKVVFDRYESRDTVDTFGDKLVRYIIENGYVFVNSKATVDQVNNDINTITSTIQQSLLKGGNAPLTLNSQFFDLHKTEGGLTGLFSTDLIPSTYQQMSAFINDVVLNGVEYSNYIDPFTKDGSLPQAIQTTLNALGFNGDMNYIQSKIDAFNGFYSATNSRGIRGETIESAKTLARVQSTMAFITNIFISGLNYFNFFNVYKGQLMLSVIVDGLSVIIETIPYIDMTTEDTTTVDTESNGDSENKDDKNNNE